MVKSSTARILPGKAHGNAFHKERSESQRFSHSIIHRQLAGAHLLALLQQFLDLGMNGKTLRGTLSASPVISCSLLGIHCVGTSYSGL